MTLEQIKEVLKTDAYAFLREHPNLGSHIMLLGLGGSHAYGTNIETSDLDIRGIAFNTKEEILLGRSFEQVVNTATDTTIYAFNKMIGLLAAMNPNTIELLGLEPDQYLFLTRTGAELLDNKDMFLSKRCIGTFGGYATQQLYRMKQLSAHEMQQTELEQHILKTLEFMEANFGEKYTGMPDDGLKLYIDDSDREEMETEIFMDVRLTHYPLRDYCSLWNELQNTVKQYNKVGKRNEHAVEHAKLNKHQMHLVRLDHMCLDLLEGRGIITFRKEDHEELMQIRGGAYVTDDNQIRPEFFELVDELERKLDYAKKHTELPDEPDLKRIQEFTMSVNENIVRYS